MTVLLKASHVTRVLQEALPVTLVQDANVEVRAGEFVAITGPSGSGKSSLLYLLGLLDKPTAGAIEIEGRPTGPLDEDALAALRLEKLGFVFQSHFLLPEFTALENVMLPMRRLGQRTDRECRDRATEILVTVGLSEHSHKLPQQMSGGQRQRVAVARALANDPLLVLADEPTGNLDSVSSNMVQHLLKDLAADKKRAVIAVTHDPGFAAMAARQIHIVDGRISA